MVDASVAVHWYLDSPLAERARSIFEGESILVAPDLVVAEVANAAWKLRLSGSITPKEGSLIATAVASAFARLVPAAELIKGAYSIATELRHPIYDCLYLHLAEFESTRVLTADKRLIQTVRGSRWQRIPIALEDWSGP